MVYSLPGAKDQSQISKAILPLLTRDYDLPLPGQACFSACLPTPTLT